MLSAREVLCERREKPSTKASSCISSYLERIGIKSPPAKIVKKRAGKEDPSSKDESHAAAVASKLGATLMVANHVQAASRLDVDFARSKEAEDGMNDLIAAGRFLDDPHDLNLRHARVRAAESEARGTGQEEKSKGCGGSAAEALVDLCVGPSFRRASDGGNSLEAMGYPDPCAISGDERLSLIRNLLDEYKWERQDNQVQFHELMIKTFLPSIFIKEWDTQYDRILRLFGLHDHCAESLIVCPRRFGKTVSVAMMAAVLFFCIPDADIAIFSTCKRTAYKMMWAIYEFMKEIPYFKDAIFMTRNSETIICELYGNVKKMAAYPGTVAVSLSVSVGCFVVYLESFFFCFLCTLVVRFLFQRFRI